MLSINPQQERQNVVRDISTNRLLLPKKMEVSDFLKVSVITTFYTMKFFNIPKLLHVHKKFFHTKKNIQIPCIKIYFVLLRD